MSVLSIKDLHVAIGDKEILKGINLTINTGETHALMGPNGNVTQGTITLDGEDVLSMSVDERSRKGLFLGMQYPQEIPGVTNSDFLRSAMNARREKPLSLYQFIKAMDHATEDLEMDGNLAHRYLNEGFSGGEKKRNEILQMKLLEPKFALLDEIDSGLDVDALRIVADNINEMREKNEDFGLVMVSHYERLYELVKPTHVHVLVDGNIVVEGGFELIERINNEGYEWVKKELGIELQKEDEDVVSIGVCGHKVTSNV